MSAVLAPTADATRAPAVHQRNAVEVTHFPAFDGLRAIAALAVLVTHASFLAGANTSHALGAYFARMDAGVSVFFLISGFLLYRPFVAAHLDRGGGRRFGSYLRRRLLRILPAYWVALTLVAFVFGLAEINNATDVVVYYGLLQIYDPVRILGGVTPAWSLCTELAFYLFLPVYALAIRSVARRTSRPVRVELAGLGVLVAVSFAFRAYLLANDMQGHRAFTWLPAYLDLFALGMFLAVVSAAAARRGTTPRPAAFAGRHPGLCWVLAAVCFWAVSTQVGLSVELAVNEPWQDLARQTLYGATAFFLLLPAVFGPQGDGAIRRVLASRAMVGLGLVSYGIYLWHKPMLDGLFEWSGRGLFEIPFVPLLAFAGATSLALAAVSYLVVEKPALRLK